MVAIGHQEMCHPEPYAFSHRILRHLGVHPIAEQSRDFRTLELHVEHLHLTLRPERLFHYPTGPPL
jgi:hypothetical protein